MTDTALSSSWTTGHEAPAFDTQSSVHQFAAQANVWAQQAASLKATAAAGHFAVDTQSGQAFVDAYNHALSKLPSIAYHIDNITRTYMLGVSPGGQQIAPWNLQVAQELKTAISQLENFYTSARDAHVQAIRNYQNTELSVTDALHHAGRN